MICPKCGNKCDDKLMFCNTCGTKLKTFVNGYEEFLVPEEMEQESIEIQAKPIVTEAIVISGDSDTATIKEERKIKKATPKLESELLDGEIDDVMEKKSTSTKSKYTNGKYSSSDKNNKKTKKSGKKIAIIIAISITAVLITIFTTIAIKKNSMTKKFNHYYNQGTVYFNAQNYKDARTQFYTASNNAVTKEQRVKAYVMVYKSDSIIGGYDEEEIDFLEALIAIDDSNIEYYKELIVLYQNNDMNSKIQPLIASAPSSMREELTNYNGTIPVANYKEGVYRNPINVELSSSNDVTIYYTTDGSNVIESETKQEYSMPIKLAKEGIYTIRAYSVTKSGKASKEMTVKYTLEFIKVDEPSINLDSGKYTDEQKIEVTADSDCTVYYTTDGTTPTAKSKKYKEPIEMPKGDSLYYFVAINSEGVASNITTRVYNFIPQYTISYDQALDSIRYYISDIDAEFNEADNGDVVYFEFKEIKEIEEKEYYIISCQRTTKKNKKKYALCAVSCDDGVCYKALSNDESGYDLTEFNIGDNIFSE